MQVGFASSPKFVDHDTGPHHPERPNRIRAIYKGLLEAGLYEDDPFPEYHLDPGIRPSTMDPLVILSEREATRELLELVHPGAYVTHMQSVCARGGVADDSDTVVVPASWPTALLSAGTVVNACHAVGSGKLKRAFAATRPPGHHAEPAQCMGFCLFANVSIGARYLQKTFGIERVAIVDFDVHHGNGTQAVFYDDPSVLFVSIHQHPESSYPHTGYESETGTGKGVGYNINIPMAPGSDDADYDVAFDQKILPRLDAFKPEILMISAGFDAHRDDPLADINLSDDAFEIMTKMLVDVANVHCAGRVVSALEGGYNLEALSRGVVRHLRGLAT